VLPRPRRRRRPTIGVGLGLNVGTVLTDWLAASVTGVAVERHARLARLGVDILSSTGSVEVREELPLTKEAFRTAHGRFLAAHASRDVQAWYAALSETLMWICVLDGLYDKQYPATYMKFRDASAYGYELPGLRWARNRAVHQVGLLLVDPVTGTPSGPPSDESSSGVRLDQLVWRRADELPSAKRGHDGGRACYEENLQGNAVRYSLRRMNYFFIRPRGGLDAALV